MVKDGLLLSFFILLLAPFSAHGHEWLIRERHKDLFGCLRKLDSQLRHRDLGMAGWHWVKFSQPLNRGLLRKHCGARLREMDLEPNQYWQVLEEKPKYRPQPLPPVGQDPFETEQWALREIRADHLPDSPGVRVALLDTGVDYNHPEIQKALWRNRGEMGVDAQGRDKATNGIDDDGNGYIDDVFGWDFVDQDNRPFDLIRGVSEGHGTHIAGIIAAQAKNSMGIRGIAPRTELMVLRFINSRGYGTTDAAIQAIHYALKQGAKILNISWGGSLDVVSNSVALKEAFLEAERRGVLVVVAAGNGGFNIDEQPQRAIPASYGLSNMIVVAASGPGGHRATFSNYGLRRVHLAAPGVGILSTLPRDEWGRSDGSSVAVPHVVGVLSLGWGLYPLKKPVEIKRALLASVSLVPTLTERVASGGNLNAAAFLEQLSDDRILTEK